MIKNYKFYEKTGFLKDNLYFCNEYSDKARLCDNLKVDYRPVHSKTLTNDVQYFPPRERVY